MDLSVGAVGAAIIAGLVSLLGLIIGKEQKVSEFRQAWINDLRQCLISYISNLNAICDAIRSKSKDNLVDRYKALNEAHHGIILRLNSKEAEAAALNAAMSNFENIAKSNATLIPDNISSLEEEFIKSAKSLLKMEWNRVKRGEKFYVWARWSVIILTALMGSIFIGLFFFGNSEKRQSPHNLNVRTQISCFFASKGRQHGGCVGQVVQDRLAP